MTFEEDGRKVSGFSSELFAGASIDFLSSRPREPFFCFVSFTAPHDPRTPPVGYKTMYDPGSIPLPKNFLPKHPFDNGELEIRDEKLLPWPRTPEAVRGELADYYGMISHLDEQIGRILAALEATGAAARTAVVFSADNGLAVGSHGLLGKMSMYDHSVRVPLVIRAAGRGRPGARLDSLCYVHDIFPTACELAGIAPPPTVEGRSVFSSRRRDAVFASYRDVQRMVRTRRFKLIYYPKIQKTQLFDLAEDPDEMRDLAGRPEQATRVAELRAKLSQWQRSVGDPLAGGTA
jgi:arylsulfatase A-like enzyme